MKHTPNPRSRTANPANRSRSQRSRTAPSKSTQTRSARTTAHSKASTSRQNATRTQRGPTRARRVKAIQHAKKNELQLQRRHAFQFLLMLPLLLALYGFFGLQKSHPTWPGAPLETTPRGSILSRDGTLFAEGGVTYRQYPQGNLAAHVIGFSGALQAGGNYGLEGLEFTQETKLQRGEDIVITIDPHMQSVAQAELANYIQNERAESGSVVMLEAGTGRVLAAASYPEFDPNQQASLSDREVVLNKAFLNLFEPGSVMKPFVIAALLEHDRLRLDEIIDTPMSLRVGDQTFHDAAQHDPYLSPWGILKYSSNSGMLKLTERFDDDELLAWLKHFGFGRDVGLTDVYTRTGQVRDTPWVPQDQASITIGQSMSTTTLQLAAAYSIFANDGVYITPYMIEGDTVPAPRQIITAETAQTLRRMLKYVVDENSSMHHAMAPTVSVAGKTGTADIFDQTTLSYIDEDYTLTFAGMFPAEQPKVTMVVSIQKPRGNTSSTHVAAPLFGDIQREVVSLWQPSGSSVYAENP